MIPLALETSRQHVVIRSLRYAWFFALATIAPLIDFVRSGSSLSLAGLVTGILIISLIVGFEIYKLFFGSRALRYELRYGELTIETVSTTYRISTRFMARLEVINLNGIKYRTGTSVPGYHVGRFQHHDYGLLRVVASTLQNKGLLIYYKSYHLFGSHTRKLLITPEEPEVISYMLQEDIAENQWRLAFGQP